MKYRIWDKEKQEYFKQGAWETFVWVDHEGKPFEIDITVHGQHMNPKDVSEKYEVEYTLGHKDIDGSDVYDNDIVRRTVTQDVERAYKKNTYPYWKIIGNKNQNKELWESL